MTGVAIAVLVMLVWAAGFYWYLMATAKTDLAEFREMFPGRCPICSFHEFGWKEGYERDRTPRPHSCIERGGRMWPTVGVSVTK